MDWIAKLIGYVVLAFIAVAIWNEHSSDANDAARKPLAATEQGSTPAARPKEASPPTPVKFIDEDRFVATEDAAVVHFNVKGRVKVRMLISIDNAVPLDVVAMSGAVSKNDYVMAAAVKSFADVMSILSDDARKNNPDFFGDDLSKQSAYKRFESPWVQLNAGKYSVVLDNTGTFTPTRGDAAVNVKLFWLPAE